MTVEAVTVEAEGADIKKSVISGQLGPLIRQAWYVIAVSDDVGRELSSITVLNQPMVFFRGQDGLPVVLDDRCAHRRYSLAKGHLDGDAVRCGYHGFTFDRTGACIFAPGFSGELNFGVRRYPAIDHGLWLWVWMGDGDGDPADIPDPQVLNQTTFEVHGYTHNPCNYQLMHENLLDLTHLHYLHGPMVASEEYANTPPTMLTATDSRPIGHGSNMAPTNIALPTLFCGADPTLRLSQEEELWSIGPSLNYGFQRYYTADGRPATPHHIAVAHAITPESETSTHQFWTVRADAPLRGTDEELVTAVQTIFHQDVEVLAVQNSYVVSDTRPGVVENSIPSDVAGLRVRRMLQRMAAAECGDATGRYIGG